MNRLLPTTNVNIAKCFMDVLPDQKMSMNNASLPVASFLVLKGVVDIKDPHVLNYAIYEDDESLVRFLVDCDTNIHEDSIGFATWLGRESILRFLLDKCLSIHGDDDDWWIHLAEWNDHEIVVEYLVKKNIDVRAPSGWLWDLYDRYRFFGCGAVT